MTAPTSARPAILVVDDTSVNIVILLRFLEDSYDVSFATSGNQALELVEKDPKPDLILLDMMMPDMDGRDVLTVLKRDPATRDIPVIFVTSRLDGATERDALAAGAVDYLQKPINRDVVRARVKLQIELARQRKQAEQHAQTTTRKLAQAQDEAGRVERAKVSFLSSLTHDLRIPMYEIRDMNAKALQAASDPEQKKILTAQGESSTRLLNVINDMLDFVKVETDQIAIDTVNFDVREMLDRIERASRELAITKNVEILWELDPDVPQRLKGDPLHLAQILGCLISHVTSHVEKGRITVRVLMIGASNAQASLRFEVSDQGTRIPTEVLNVLLQPLSQYNELSARPYGGMRLALALCKRLLWLMSGELGVSISPGNASTFWFTVRLPVADVPILNGPLVDWKIAKEEVARIVTFLSDDDIRAGTRMTQAPELFEVLLKDRVDVFRLAIDSFDFTSALQILREAVAARPELQDDSRR